MFDFFFFLIQHIHTCGAAQTSLILLRSPGSSRRLLNYPHHQESCGRFGCLERSSPARGNNGPVVVFIVAFLQRRVSAPSSLAEVNGSTWELISLGLLSRGPSGQRYRNWASFTSFNFRLLLSFHLALLHSHHHCPLVRYKHFESRLYDCLHLPQRGLKTSCCCCCCFLRSV